ncbi:poly (A) polymerase, putative [Bodo saltans]|uniref:Poly(A) polymerase n=1 Tax=Bodo saltans TaxID=75058 RepID=A0A0S4JIG5_BODSA|nr:poly (A) polymerase, putative [Bodo saltans]|eukprot:CUG88196.1 poly (A) polymerase, putative [Bodo saltans]
MSKEVVRHSLLCYALLHCLHRPTRRNKAGFKHKVNILKEQMSAADAIAARALSIDGASAGELKQDAPLAEWCATRREPEEESERRRNVLSRLQGITRMWIRTTMISEFRMQPEAASLVDGRLFTTGSYRYNVHSSGSDIDMVLIAPERITREHFFTTLVERLRGEPWISQLDMIRDARVPIIAMKADGIDIDLSFGTIKRTVVPEVITDDILRGLDETSVRSCNAVRVASAVIDMVPNKGAFRQALRFIKSWGKERGVYNLKLGYPSGIGWALLVAKTCQNYPNKNAAGVLCGFFRVYSKWFRPDPHVTGEPNRAIFLTDSLTPTVNLGPCWDPRINMRDAQALFPVITPANPYSNACYNVSTTTLRVLCKEFQRGHEILSEGMSHDVEELAQLYGSPFGIWKKLLEPYAFVPNQNYLVVRVTCTDAEHYTRYVDTVETKVALLWAENQYTRGAALESFSHVTVRPMSSRFEDPDETKIREAIIKSKRTGAPLGITVPPTQTYTAYFLAGLEVKAPVPGEQQRKVDLTRIIQMFTEQVKQLHGAFQAPMTKVPVVEVTKMEKLPSFITGVSNKRERDESTVTGDTTTAKIDGSGAAAQGKSASTPLSAKSSAPPVSPVDIAAPPPTPITPLSATSSSSVAPSEQQKAAAAPQQQRASAFDEALGMDF